MPYEKGGRADKKGNKYEINWVVLENYIIGADIVYKEKWNVKR